MKFIVSLALIVSVGLASCSTFRVLVESNHPNQVRLSSQKEGCKQHASEIVTYWAWGAGGTKSTAPLLEGAKGPVRVEFKNSVGSVMLEALSWTFLLGFLRFKKLEVYECRE
ncbi:MAG: hypothetical protein PF689_12230 [Deltaproteobacteria bacterium]|jgi:hypothetical protein|nr:hypothetical protein [Deltaproteobacteria bacterium]